MKDAQTKLEKLLEEVSEGKPLTATLLVSEGGTSEQYLAKVGFPKEEAKDEPKANDKK